MKQRLIPYLLFLLPILIFSRANAQDWPPTLERSEVINNRVTDRYKHGSLPQWGARNPEQTDEFAVLHPLVPELENAEDRPLYVILHSAGHALDSTLACQSEKGNHDIYDSPDDFYALILDCRANRETDWWWGGLEPGEEVNDSNRDKAGPGLSPCEKRVIDTILWTIAHYKIDPNRVYLSGNSMGGSGTLGIGLNHGDLFAAVKANVPAGCRHADSRLFFPPNEVPQGVKIPDPPICVDYSGSNDHWSADHAVLINGMRLRKYPLMLFWGPYGHQNNHEKIEQINDLPNRFDWTAVRRNEAYPVFTYAASDSPNPWPDPVNDCPADAPAGQINGFFRWKTETDSTEELSMSLRLASSDELRSKIFTIPAATTADVSFRRLQKFHVEPNETVYWSFGTLRGKVRTDNEGVITIPRLPIETQAQTISIRKTPPCCGETVDAAQFGFDPNAPAEINSAALQKALDGGNKTVTVKNPGDYLLDKTILIDSGTRLIFAEGAVLKKDQNYVHVILNRGALNGEQNENIEIENLHIAVNGKTAGWGPNDLLFGLRGQAAFYRIKNLHLSNFKCLDVHGGQYALQICDFENIAVDSFEIRGQKDGIHLGNGRGFYLAHGVCQTFDDAIALNAEDYTSSQPIEGDILDGLVEEVTDERLDPTVAHAVRLLTGAWVDWHPGIKFQNGDTFLHNGYFYRVIATFDTNEYASNTAPPNHAGAWQDPDEPNLTFVCRGKANWHSANIKNVTFKNIRSLSRVGFGAFWEMCDYHRAVHPEVASEDLPVCQISVENFENDSPGRAPLLNVTLNLEARLLDVSSTGKIANISSSGRPIEVNLDLRGSRFKEDGRDENLSDFKTAPNTLLRLTLAGDTAERPVRIDENGGTVETLGQAAEVR